jgi:hypothetical protein
MSMQKYCSSSTLAASGANYIIFLNVEIFKNYFSQRKEKKRIFCEEK